MKSPDEVVDKFVDSTVLKGVQEEVIRPDEFDASEVETQCVPGFCKKHPLWLRSSQFVKVLHSQFEAHNVRAGSLVVITVDGFPLTMPFFLGVILKKPLLQTAVLARVEDDTVSFIKEKDCPWSLPQITTTFHIFREILERTSATLEEVNVEHWSFRPALLQGSNIVVNAESVLASFAVNSVKGPSVHRKPPVRLPFGLTGHSRKRKKPQTAPKREAKSRKAKRDEPSDEGSSEIDPLLDVPAKEDPQHEEDEVEPISETMAQSVQDSHSVAREIHEADQAREALAAECRANPATGRTSGGGSFFSKKLGLGQGGIAPTGRAKCRSCGQCIPKHTVRFEWWWNMLRPNSWCHPECLVTLTREMSLKADTVEQLNKIIAQPGSVDDPVRREASRVLAAISAIST